MSNGAIATVSQGAAALTEATNSLAIDSKGLSSLKRSAHDNSPEAIRGVAKQFEAYVFGIVDPGPTGFGDIPDFGEEIK